MSSVGDAGAVDKMASGASAVRDFAWSSSPSVLGASIDASEGGR